MPDLNQAPFPAAAGSLLTAVSVVTTVADGVRFGMTASSVTTLSWAPAMMLVCVKHGAPTGQAIADAGFFTINVLSRRQTTVAKQFATPGDDKFAGLATDAGVLGAPCLPESIAVVECEVDDAITAASHTIFIGRVVEARVGEGDPLAYLRGSFGGFQADADHRVYARVRQAILDGTWGSTWGAAARSVTDIADELGEEPVSVFGAMTRLTSEGYAQRVEGGYAVTALALDTVQHAMRARAIIECGVVRARASHAPEHRIAAVRRRFDDMERLMIGDTLADVDEFFDVNFAFHREIVGLADNPALGQAFEQLGIREMTKWFHSGTTQSDGEFMRVQRAIVEQLEHRDPDGAERAVDTYTELALRRVGQLLGGEVAA